PAASSIPARTPIIHASPSTPPPPRPSTSGRDRIMAVQATDALFVRDSIRTYVGFQHERGHRLADQGAARGHGSLAARPGGALGRERADALAGRARGDEPDPAGGQADRRRPGAAALAATAPRRRRRGE